ncbi:PepSY domain-containing protein [Allosphingosinicella humi]
MQLRGKLRRYHVWLGWIVGIPLLIWTATGFFMASQPIGTVRGEKLLAESTPLALAAPPVPPAIGPRPVGSLTLAPLGANARWVIRYQDGGARLADPATGRLLPSLTAADAAAILRARYQGDSRIAAVERTKADAPPIDFRRPIESWRVVMDNGERFYIDAATGEIVARRTARWRIYDFFWGLHIMDLDAREDINNGWLLGFGAVSLATIVMALILLPMTVRRRRR